MIKKCKITKIINPPIRGVINKPIREGDIVDMQVGQIRACLGICTIDEILPSGSLVRLNLDNYKKDNSIVSSNITIEDAVTPLNTNVDGVTIPEPEPATLDNIEPEPIKDKVPDEDIPALDTTTEEDTVEEVKEEVKEEAPKNNVPKKKRK